MALSHRIIALWVHPFRVRLIVSLLSYTVDIMGSLDTIVKRVHLQGYTFTAFIYRDTHLHHSFTGIHTYNIHLLSQIYSEQIMEWLMNKCHNNLVYHEVYPPRTWQYLLSKLGGQVIRTPMYSLLCAS